MMPMSFPDKELEGSAHDAFAFLFSEWNAQIVQSRFDRQVFSNGFVVIRAGNAVIRIVRDRGVLSVEVGPERADAWDWFDLERVVQILRGMTIGWPISDGSLTDLGRILRENISEIMSAFSDERFPATKARLKTALEKAHRPPTAT